MRIFTKSYSTFKDLSETIYKWKKHRNEVWYYPVGRKCPKKIKITQKFFSVFFNMRKSK